MNAPGSASTSHCPYCKGTVSADLIRCGGNCPHCLLEIPGEEAPTDPGLQARMRQKAEAMQQAKRGQSRNMLLALAGVCVAAALGGAGWWQMHKDAEALVYELDDAYMAPKDGMIAAAVAPPPPVAAAAAVATAPTRNAKSGSKSPTRNETDFFAGEGGENVASAKESGTVSTSLKYVPSRPMEDIKVGLGAGTPILSPLGGVDIAIKRKSSAVLETDDEITVMAKRVTGAYQPQIDTCAQQQLKENPAFAGAWRVTFTIGTEGTIFALKIKGLDESKEAFEACIKRNVSSWRFERIAKEFPVAKTYRFAPQ